MKQAIKALALACVMALDCTAFCACGARAKAPRQEETKPAATALTNENGVVLMDNPAIDANDTAAQEKLEQYIQSQNFAAKTANLSSDYYTARAFAKGNAIVLEMDVTADLTDAQKQSLNGTAEAIKMNMDFSLAQGRTATGVSNLVIVAAFVDKDNTVLASAISDKAQEAVSTTAPPQQSTTQSATEAENNENSDNAESAENGEAEEAE